VATNLRLDREGRAREPFRYFDKGQMATVGRNRALVEMGDWKLVGWFAWVAWLFVHILYLIDFRNRLLVLTQWFWSYVTFHRGARLILSKEWRSFGKGDS
jgi:NADH dehydrogenase